ncbi:DUF397 domain-containing protein [Actinomadura macra]|uniref:DUF397 domain-containing protein n=1 Tax=Actinomadura macra TaxID=46164 RepID=UPI0009FE7DC6|nr:DUF397 domain-containing protein [Actinomadura macra]
MTEWRRSTCSGTTGQSDCVEVASLHGSVGVRDSKDPNGPRLVVSRDDFATLITGLKR